METIQMCTSSTLEVHCVIFHSYNGMLHIIKEDELLIHTHRHDSKWKKPCVKDFTLYDSICIKLKDRQNESMVMEMRIVVSSEQGWVLTG